MGTSVDAHCYGCGFDCVVLVGGGMRNFATFAAWPIHCRPCQDVSAVNLRESDLKCLACGSRDVAFFEEAAGEGRDGEEGRWRALRDANLIRRGHAPGIQNSNGGRWVVGLDDHTLSKAAYECPKCGKTALRFGTEYTSSPLLWD